MSKSGITNERSITMSKRTGNIVRNTAIGVVTGGLAFWAARSLTNSKRMRRKAVAKAVKTVGNLMDSL